MNIQRHHIQEKIFNFRKLLSEDGVDSVLESCLLAPNTSIYGPKVESQLREEVAVHFGVNCDDVIIVGSAKLWFSPKPGQYFKPFSTSSDIDIAIISSSFFERIWQEVFEMEYAGIYFDFEQFKHYHFQGWARPDKIPKGSAYTTSKDWWEFFQILSGREDYGRFKIRAGLYHNRYYLRQYHARNFTSLKESIVSGVTK